MQGQSLRVDDAELLRVLEETQQEFPDFTLIPKASVWWMKVISVLLKIITFGQMISFMSRYVTTIGNTIYTSELWDDNPPFMKAALIRHERVHMRQRKSMGSIRYALTYLFWPLPVVFAAGRKRIEMGGYAESMVAYTEYYGIEFVKLTRIRERIIGEFTGSTYFWTWPFRKSIERWYDGVVSHLEQNPVRNVHAETR